MNSHASTSRYILTALAIILVITAFVLVGLNAMNLTPSVNPFSGASQAQLDEKYKEGFLAARAMYAPLLPELATADAKVFDATITSIDGMRLTVEARNLDTFEPVDGVGTTRQVQLTSATKIRKLSSKNPDVLAAELAAYEAQNNPALPPPSPEVETIVTLSSLASGMHIRVHSDQNVRLLSEIDATIVTVVE